MERLFLHFSLLLLLALPANLFAQQGPGPGPKPERQPGKKKEQIEAMRVAFLTRKLELTEKEAQQFWPVYNEYQDKLEAIRKNRRKEIKEGKDEEPGISDQEASQLIEAELQAKTKELEINKTYSTRFIQVLGAKKTYRLMRAEDEFKKELIRQLKEKK